MATYICSSCRFRLDTNRLPKICPFCSRQNSMNKEQTAEELIQDIEKMSE